jgi:hypothetical protein
MADFDDRGDVSEGADSALAELEAALRDNPELRGKTPPPQQGEWEDFDRLLAENPQLAAPIKPARVSGTAFYYYKDRWECRHENEPVKTAIEREPVPGEKDGIDPATGQIHPDALLINEIRGICPDCMAKWAAGPNDRDDEPYRGDSSQDPAGYDPTGVHAGPRADDFDDDDEDDDHARLGRRMGELEIDEGPGKDKYTSGGYDGPPPSSQNRELSDDEGGDDFEDESDDEQESRPLSPDAARGPPPY